MNHLRKIFLTHFEMVIEAFYRHALAAGHIQYYMCRSRGGKGGGPNPPAEFKFL